MLWLAGSNLDSLAVLCVMMLSVRGSQTRWRSLGILDGAPVEQD